MIRHAYTVKDDIYSRMTATRANLIAEARNIRHSLEGLSVGEVQEAIREVLRYYSPHSCAADLESILSESMNEVSEINDSV